MRAQTKRCFDWALQRSNANAGPVVIGGLGGSGTRVPALILRGGGLYTGGELNDAGDNLWFTLLFRRPRTVRDPDDVRLMPLLDLFEARMKGRHRWTTREQKLLWSCACEFAFYNYVPSNRFGFPLRTLRSFYGKRKSNVDTAWGWKEPNAHIFLPLLTKRFEHMQYIHVLRHPLDAVFGNNQRQLHNWGFLFGIDERSRDAMLQFHQATNRRAMAFGKSLGERFMLLRYEELCAAPRYWTERLLHFTGLDTSAHSVEQAQRFVVAERVAPRVPNQIDADLLTSANLVAEEFGYPISQSVVR